MWGSGASGRQFPKGASVSRHNGFQLHLFGDSFRFPNLRCTIVETEALLLIVPLYGVQPTVAEVCLICLKI